MSSCGTACRNLQAPAPRAALCTTMLAAVPSLAASPVLDAPPAPADPQADLLVLVAHELRGRMHALSGALEVLDTAAPGSAVDAEARAVASRQGRQLAHLLDELLDAGRVLAGRSGLALHSVELCGLLERLSRDGVGAARCALRGAAAWARADGRRVQQALARVLQCAALQAERLRVHVGCERDRCVVRIEAAGASPLHWPSGDVGVALADRLLQLQGGEFDAGAPAWHIRLPRATAPG